MKKVFGYGINDIENGSKLRSYSFWHSMVRRCYSENYKKGRNSYDGCTVSEDWLHFSNFNSWFEDNFVEGFQLDKDLFGDSKVYSENNCCFLPRELNGLIQNFKKGDDSLPLGVTYKKANKKYVAQISKTRNGVRKSEHLYIGEDKELCAEIYQKAKRDYLAEIAMEFKDTLKPHVYEKLLEVKC